MRALFFLLLPLAASVAFAADPRMVTVPEQTPPPPTAPAPVPKPSPPPTEGPNAPPLSPTQPQPGVSQSGTEQAPLFVRVLPDPKTADEAEAERRDREQRAANEQGVTTYTRYLWLATAALAIVAAVQAGLFVWQLILLRRSIRDSALAANAAGAAAKAAQISAEAQKAMAVAMARPRIVIRRVTVARFAPNRPIAVEFSLVNVGDTSAIIVERNTTVLPLTTDAGPALIFGEHGTRTAEHPLAPGEELVDVADTFAAVPESTLSLIRGRQMHLYLFGYVRYRDDFGALRRMGFARILNEQRRFDVFSDPDYEYSD